MGVVRDIDLQSLILLVVTKKSQDTRVAKYASLFVVFVCEGSALLLIFFASLNVNPSCISFLVKNSPVVRLFLRLPSFMNQFARFVKPHRVRNRSRGLANRIIQAPHRTTHQKPPCYQEVNPFDVKSRQFGEALATVVPAYASLPVPVYPRLQVDTKGSVVVTASGYRRSISPSFITSRDRTDLPHTDPR